MEVIKLKKKLLLIMVLFLMISGCTIGTNSLQTSDLEIKETEENNSMIKMTWIWDSYNHINSDTINDLIEMNINMVSINTGYEKQVNEQYILNHKSIYEDFITQANKSKIKVNALFGTPLWAYKEEYEYMESQIQEVLNYNKEYKNPRFSGIHLDIEPHAITDEKNKNLWDTWTDQEKNAVIKEMIINLQKIKAKIDKHNEKHNDNLKLVIDIAPGISKYKDFANKLFNVIDIMVLMDYTKNHEKYIDYAEYYLKVGSKSNKKIIIGSEFQKDDDYANISLYEMKKEDILTYFKNGLNKFEEYNSFSGLGVHGFYDYYECMKNIQ